MRRLALALVLIAACSPGTDAVPAVEAPPAGSPTSTPVTATTLVPTIAPTASSAPDTPPTAFSAGDTALSASSTIPAITGTEEFPVPGKRPHDVAAGREGTVWYTAQGAGSLDRLDPGTGEVTQVPLGAGAAPHGVVVGFDGAAWVTDQGLNALVRVDHDSLDFEVYTAEVDVAMHTGAFSPDGILWFTGQRGYVGRFDPATETMELFETGGDGPYGITVTPTGDVYFAALSGSYIARVDPETGDIARLDPPTPDQGARRVWSDSAGRVWVSYWNTGHLARYDPAADSWSEWELPGDNPQAYAVYVDHTDRPWVSDFGGEQALLRFDPVSEDFESVPLPTPGGEVRQLLGRPGEVWGAESAVDAVIVVRYGG